LEIIKKLPNGYHQLRSVMLKLNNLCDEIEIIQAIDHELYTLEKRYHTHQNGNFNTDLNLRCRFS